MLTRVANPMPVLMMLQQEADNEVDFARVKGGAVANFNSGGAGTNHVKSLDT